MRAPAGKNCFLVICQSSFRTVKQEESATYYLTIRNLRKIKSKVFNVLQILCVCRCKHFLVVWKCKAQDFHAYFEWMCIETASTPILITSSIKLFWSINFSFFYSITVSLFPFETSFILDRQTWIALFVFLTIFEIGPGGSQYICRCYYFSQGSWKLAASGDSLQSLEHQFAYSWPLVHQIMTPGSAYEGPVKAPLNLL